MQKHIENLKESERLKREMKKKQQKKYLETIAQQEVDKKKQYIAWNYKLNDKEKGMFERNFQELAEQVNPLLM